MADYDSNDEAYNNGFSDSDDDVSDDGAMSMSPGGDDDGIAMMEPEASNQGASDESRANADGNDVTVCGLGICNLGQ